MLLLARYVVPVSRDPFENGAVLVKDGQIADVGYANVLKTRYPEEETRDFGIAAIMPGFVDVHTHLDWSVLRGLVYDSPYAAWRIQTSRKSLRLAPRDWLDSAYLGASEAVRSGITTVADVSRRSAAFEAVQDVGLRGVFYREVGTMDRHEVDHALTACFNEIDEWRRTADPAMATIGIAPSSLYTCNPKIFKAIAEYAMDGTPVAIHLAGSQAEYDFVRYGSSKFSVHADELERGFGIDMPPWLATGVSPVQYVLNWDILDVPNVLAIHCVHVDETDIDTLIAYDVSIAHCARCNAQLGMGIAPVNRFLRAGLRVGLGTDSPAASGITDPIDEMRIALLLQRAVAKTPSDFLSTREVIRMATLGAAEALGLDDKIGTLDVGKRADIIAVDLSKSHQAPTHDPNSAIVHTANQENILMTMVDGHVLFDGELEVIDAMDDDFSQRIDAMRAKLRN